MVRPQRRWRNDRFPVRAAPCIRRKYTDRSGAGDHHLRGPVHGRRGLHHAVAHALALWRRVALCGRSPGRRSWMPRRDLHTAGD